ncbi:MAG: epoxyqueuosine reductase [Candidatus Heimdallarchaeota archaeon]|nr:epoxyqueuosine reductase [Candidatus Heimdallarchaeota archaeon]
MQDENQDFTNSVKNSVLENEASIVGIADLTILDEYKHEPVIPKGFTRAVSIGIRLTDKVIDKITKGPTKEYAELYRKTNEKLNEVATHIASKFENEGFKTLRIPASQTVNYQKRYGKFPHKTAAILSGLGWIGKSALLISFEHGPRVRFATVLTDAPLIADKAQETSNCGSCKICVDACPADAMTGELWFFGDSRNKIFNAHACHKHLKIQEQKIGETICGICVALCPYGKKK